MQDKIQEYINNIELKKMKMVYSNAPFALTLQEVKK